MYQELKIERYPFGLDAMIARNKKRKTEIVAKIQLTEKEVNMIGKLEKTTLNVGLNNLTRPNLFEIIVSLGIEHQETELYQLIRQLIDK